MINFNYCVPREYKNKETKEIEYALVAAGKKMQIADLQTIQSFADGTNKKKDPWCQCFNNGIRVNTDNVDYALWNGITPSDIDTKLFYNVKKFNVDAVENALISALNYKYGDNFYAIYRTNSGTSFRVLFYWDCDRTEDNWKKCNILTRRYIQDCFYSMGEDGKKIIDYPNVLDKCTNSIYQGFYVTKNPITFGVQIGHDDFGYVDLSDVKLEDTYNISNLQYTAIEQHSTISHVKRVNISEENKKNIPYHSHHARWGLYEALIVLFKDKDKVDAEWQYICSLLPEANGHNKDFYLREPNKNKWYERFNSNVLVNIFILRQFGYSYKSTIEYKYHEQFIKSWGLSGLHKIKEYIINAEVNNYKEINPKAKKDEVSLFRQSCATQMDIDEYNDIFSDIYDNFNIEEFDGDWHNAISLKPIKDEYLELLNDVRTNFYKKRFTINDFKYLTVGYKVPDDCETYKMFYDIYYRDKNGVPTIKYDELNDDILIKDGDKLRNLRINDEWTYLCNDCVFSNKMTKDNLRTTIREFVYSNYRYHPIKEYFYNLDLSIADEEVLETWAVKFFHCDDTKLVREISKRFFIGAVKVLFSEDHFVFPHMLAIQGNSGCGKSLFAKLMFTFLNISYILSDLDPNSRPEIYGPKLLGAFCVDWSDSDCLDRTSQKRYKQFMDVCNSEIRYQRKYENEMTRQHPRVVIIRSENDDKLYNDVTIRDAGDRRSWLLKANTPANWANDPNNRKILEDMKDVIWATAYKIYLENPDINLELDMELAEELKQSQEPFNMISDSDIQELYDEIFTRNYKVNNKGHFMDEKTFLEQVKESDLKLSGYLDPNCPIECSSAYNCIININCIPGSWLTNYVNTRYGKKDSRYVILLRKYMTANGWEFTNTRYNGKVMKCWTR